MKTIQTLFVLAISGAAFAGGYPYAPAALNDVKVTGGFWLPHFETNSPTSRRRTRPLPRRPHRQAGEMQTWFAESTDATMNNK